MNLKTFNLTLNSKGHITQRESQILEFKETFRFGESLIEYARTLVSMANHQGGKIVFGVKNNPRLPIGLKDDRFNSFDPRELNRIFLNYFSENIEWSLETYAIDGKTLGIIDVLESKNKPIVCIKRSDYKSLREGAIYFRYRGETCEIRHSELISMLNAEREKERTLWMKHFQSISTIGAKSVQILDSRLGELTVNGTKILIDEKLVSKLNLIQEGSFSKKSGAPTLKLIGNIEGLVKIDSVSFNNSAYPFTQVMLSEKLGLKSNYECQVLIKFFNIKNNPDYHLNIATGIKSSVHKYSQKALDLLSLEIRKNPNIIQVAKLKNASKPSS